MKGRYNEVDLRTMDPAYRAGYIAGRDDPSGLDPDIDSDMPLYDNTSDVDRGNLGHEHGCIDSTWTNEEECR